MSISNLILVTLLILIAGLGVIYLLQTNKITILNLPNLSTFQNIIRKSLGNKSISLPNTSINVSQLLNKSSVNVNKTSVLAYTLNAINKDRLQYGLSNVTISNITSGQQHADSMLNNSYFSHWDIYGMKPYMRYTLVGGRETVDENIAYQASTDCVLNHCTGNLNLTSAITNMEYKMMYNDSICCNNAHRRNILDPHHNQVSIGLAFNGSTAYLAEDFIDNYILWNSNTPNFTNSVVSLSGTVVKNYNLSSVLISYEAPVSNLTLRQLGNTSFYGYGNNVAGIAKGFNYYYTGINTIVANSYAVTNGNFYVSFSMQGLIKHYGAGEYTVMVWLTDERIATPNNTFIGSTYTIFVNQKGQQFIPSYI